MVPKKHLTGKPERAYGRAMENSMCDALKRAIKASGGTNAMAKACGIAAPSVSGWTVAPPLRVLQIEAASGVSRHDLRPDIYGPEPEQAAS